MRKFSWVIGLLALLSSCQAIPIPEPTIKLSPANKTIYTTPTSVIEATQAPSLTDFSEAYSITIIDNWGGYLPAAPINSLYTMKNSESHYEGEALFSVGGYFVPVQKKTAFISAPKDVVQAFLQKLSQAHPENGKYEPTIEHTDDYPEIIIRLDYGKEETIEFYTSSQGDEHVPWNIQRQVLYY